MLPFPDASDTSLAVTTLLSRKSPFAAEAAAGFAFLAVAAVAALGIVSAVAAELSLPSLDC